MIETNKMFSNFYFFSKMNKKEHSFSALLVDKIDESENESENVDSENGEFPLDETGEESTENEKQKLERQYSMCVQNVDYLIARVIVEDGASALTTGINYRLKHFKMPGQFFRPK